MKRFKSPRHLQRFVSIHDPMANLFHIPRHDIPSEHHRELRAAAMETWQQIGLCCKNSVDARKSAEAFQRDY